LATGDTAKCNANPGLPALPVVSSTCVMDIGAGRMPDTGATKCLQYGAPAFASYNGHVYCCDARTERGSAVASTSWYKMGECGSCTTCGVGREQKTACSHSVDRVCRDCPVGKFKTVTGQTPCADCIVACGVGKYQKQPCTVSQPRQCATCPG
jgi:hypothetical protein